MVPTATVSSRSTHWSAIAIAISLCCFGANALAIDIPWPAKGHFQYIAQKKDLRVLLREFATSQGITVVLGEGVEGSVSGKFDLKPQAMLELLAASHGFLWYYDGSLLHITPSTDVRTDVIDLRYGSAEQLRAGLERLGLLDKRYPLRIDSDGSTAVVSGPGRYVELVQQVASNLENRQSRNQATEVHIFPLRFAWAADHEFTSGNQSITVPGVASVLNSMYQPASVITKPGSITNQQKLDPMKQSSTVTASDASTPPKKTSSGKTDGNAKTRDAIINPMENFPVIQADSRINAVLIRDSAARMKQYEDLISKLDVRPAMIEIEARIIEVSSDEAEKLGVDWRLNSTPTADAGNNIARLNDVKNFVAAGGIAKSVLANAGLNLLERVSLLASQGKANVIASPAVLTMNNLEARMDNQESFYVRVAGYQSADLFNITAGITLRVTPMIVGEGSTASIKLDVRIEDGRVNGSQTVDQIPTVKRSQINTQGFVNNGEALLIAGYGLEQESKTDVNVPGLSKIPVLGTLFRHQESSKSKMQRLFLLTPRIVDDGVDEKKPAASPTLNRDLGVSGMTVRPNMVPLLRDAGAASPSGTSTEASATSTKNAPSAPPGPQDAAAAAAQPGAATPANKPGDDTAASSKAQAATADKSAAAVTEPSRENAAQKWEIMPSDHTLKSAIQRWATAAGWQLSWELPIDFPIEASMTADGTFEQAVDVIVASMQGAGVAVNVILYGGNKVIRFVAKGEE
jgi:type III secretion protein C